jgi:hypothetical protein
MRRLITQAPRVLLLGLVAAVMVSACSQSTSAPDSLDLIVSPHPDDEMEAWSVIEANSDTYKVFVYSTLGEETSFCAPDRPGYQERTGEREPRPMPEGRYSAACENERVNSTLHFLNQMAETDPSLPSGLSESAIQWSEPFPEQGVQLVRRDGDIEEPADRRARVFDGGEQGMVVFFDMGDGDLTEAEVRWVMDTVLANRAALGIPNLPWNRLIGASFYHDATYADCVDYPHPDHKAVHLTLWNERFSEFSQQLAPTCQQDPRATLEGVTDHFEDAMQLGELAPDGHPTRLGAHNIHYGWLKSPYYAGDWMGQDELFQRNQYFWVQSS